MAKIEGRFATINNSHTVKVCIYNKNLSKPNINIDTSNSVKFSDNPVEITQQQDDTFEHILRTQCKIRLVTKEWLGDYLFAANYSSIVVNVWVDNYCVFCGYVVPRVYNQNYARVWEEVEINCVDILSTLKDRRLTDNTTYEELVAQSTTRPFSWFLGNMDLDTTTVVIPNYPDIDYGEAQMMWAEIDWTRITSQEGDITYYGVEAELVMLDEDTAMNTGNTRQGQQKTPTWVESTDTCIVDGVSYYKEYAHITVNGEDVNTGDWRVGSNAGGMPVVVRTENRVDGWTNGVLPQQFDFYEHYTTYNIYDNGMEIAASDGIGEQIPETPQTTTNGSYYEFRQGASDDVDVDENDGTIYYKDYAWVCVNGTCENSGQWQRGNVKEAPSAYTEYDEDNTTLTFYYDTIRSTRTGTTYNLNSGLNTPDEPDWYTDLVNNNSMPVTHVVFDPSFANARPTTTERWFLNMKLLTSITGINYLNTSSVTNMALMFQGCNTLPSIDVTGFDTSNVNNMKQMFGDCRVLKSLDVTGFDTSNVTNMSSMFSSCNDLVSIDVTGFDTSNVTEMWGMFNGCYDIASLDVTGFDTSNVTNMSFLFRYCESLTNIDVSNLDTSNVTDMRVMFALSGYTTLDLSTFNTSRVTKMGGMFTYCRDLTSINMSNFDMTNVVPNSQGNDLYEMFHNCDSLNTITLNNVSNDTFNKITKRPQTQLPTRVIIYRDGDTYTYNSTTDTWEIQNNN